ncbi:hypothetical protein C8R47DRAFT_604608 [Mycena vitilis]|nr:hypothetical protein C8R47DRAFT_604608 [Mycena vitilis]
MLGLPPRYIVASWERLKWLSKVSGCISTPSIMPERRFVREALILDLVKHPIILRFTSILDEQLRICIITPWHRGHIMKYIARTEGVYLKELMEQVADGLHFLSQYGIVHGDLKGVRALKTYSSTKVAKLLSPIWDYHSSKRRLSSKPQMWCTIPLRLQFHVVSYDPSTPIILVPGGPFPRHNHSAAGDVCPSRAP